MTKRFYGIKGENKMSTIRDIAKMTGASIASVSRALSGSDAISGEKKERILEAARQLGYAPNLLARSLKNSKSYTIGLIISNIDSTFYLTIARVIEEELKKHGYRLLLAYSNDNGEDERKNIELFEGTKVDGIIFTPISFENKLLIERVKSKNIALVQLFRCMYNEVNSVAIDDAKGAYLAASYLIENGHKRILLLNIESPFGSNRADGYIDAFAKAKIPVDDKLIVTLPNSEPEAKALIAKSISELSPTAIIAGVNFSGKVSVTYCKQNNIIIPNDISIIVFDDVEWNYMLDITSISQPVEYIGLSACRMVLDDIATKNNFNKKVNMVLEPSLVLRKSVKKHL